MVNENKKLTTKCTSCLRNHAANTKEKPLTIAANDHITRVYDYKDKNIRKTNGNFSNQAQNVSNSLNQMQHFHKP